MKNKIKDKLKILNTGSIFIENMSKSIEQYLSNIFQKSKYYYSRKNVFGQILNVVKDIAQLLFYYHERAVTENNVLTAQQDLSLRHFAELSGHKITYVKSSLGLVRMELLPDFYSKFGNMVFLRKYARFKNVLNNQYYLLDIDTEHVILNDSTFLKFLPLIEGQVKSANFIATSNKQFKINLSDSNNKIDDSRIRVWVNNKLFKRFDCLFDMGLNDEGYFIKAGFVSQYEIIFGNGINGITLNDGDVIKIEYIISKGESGNIADNLFPNFEIVSGIFDSNGEEIQINEFSSIRKESGFNLGSDGDSIETLRNVIGFSSRSLILVDERSFISFLSKYSFISKIHLYNSIDNPRVKNILILPNLSTKFNNSDDYLNTDIDTFKISNDIKSNIEKTIMQNEISYIANELVWIDAEFIKYALFIYLEPKYDSLNNDNIYNEIKDLVVRIFIEHSFSRLKNNSNIPKSYIISQIQNLVGDDVQISINIFSSINEESKINQYYIKKYMENGILKNKRIEIPFGEDYHLGLSDRNDIQLDYSFEIPLLRGNFNILSNENEKIMIENPINLYIKQNDNWNIIN